MAKRSDELVRVGWTFEPNHCSKNHCNQSLGPIHQGYGFTKYSLGAYQTTGLAWNLFYYIRYYCPYYASMVETDKVQHTLVERDDGWGRIPGVV